MENKNACYRTVKGSLTIEASLVTAGTILILFSFLVLTMWLCDRLTVGAALREGVELGRREGVETIRTWLEEEEGQLIWMEGHLTEGYVGGQRVCFGWSSPGQMVFPGGELSFSEQVERRFYDPPGFLRLCRMAESWAE